MHWDVMTNSPSETITDVSLWQLPRFGKMIDFLLRSEVRQDTIAKLRRLGKFPRPPRHENPFLSLDLHTVQPQRDQR